MVVKTYFIRLEQSWNGDQEFCRSVALAGADVVLNWTAGEIGARPLMDFIGDRYVPASDGLLSVQGLIREISAWPAGVDVKGVADILRDLREWEQVLAAAEQRGARWRLEVGYKGEGDGAPVSPTRLG
jgi:hypothetical protein